MSLLNWIDAMFFGVRRLFDGSDTALPERPAVKFGGACSVVDDPAGNRTVVTVGGLLPDAGGGFTIGTAAGGWVTVKSDTSGFRIADAKESGYALVVDNTNAVISLGYRAELAGTLRLADTTAQLPPPSGVALQAVKGALRVAQHAPPVVSGSRGGNAALASLIAALSGAGIIVDQTVP